MRQLEGLGLVRPAQVRGVLDIYAPRWTDPEGQVTYAASNAPHLWQHHYNRANAIVTQLGGRTAPKSARQRTTAHGLVDGIVRD
jgi:hypothetical protein